MNGEQANGGGRILVVDDEPSIVDAVATALRYEGFDGREERTGRGAISAVTDFEPDLVVLDWMLPDLDGIEVGRRLRQRGFKTAILFLTAKDAVENRVEGLRAGGDDYVTKPFSLAEVRRACAWSSSSRRAHRSPPTSSPAPPRPAEGSRSKTRWSSPDPRRR
jgi:DNA-binding response OmpR family regulator